MFFAKKFVRRASGAVLAALLVIGLVPIRAAAYTCPCTIWPSSSTPATLTDPDTGAVELGVKFRSDIAGIITGIRFYKGPQNTGIHDGSLWTSTGVKLASATFTNETASGWQQVSFTSPVSIAANTTYVASYHAPAGRYSVTENYFTGTTGGDTPVHGLASNMNGGNGVYKYGASGFPTQTYKKSNYWVDVVFATQPTDTTPPAVTTTSPTDNATDVATTSDVSATFSEALDASTVNTSTFELRATATNTLIPSTVSYAGTTATLNPTDDLASNTSYTVTLKGGSTDPRIKDTAGNALANNVSWSFTTTAAGTPGLDQGPGGPILVIKDDSNPYSKYLAEILRAEGFNSFASTTPTSITAGELAAYDVVIVGDVEISPSQAATLDAWVNGGGNLIAMSPDNDLDSLLGLTTQSGTLDNGYLQVDTSSAPGSGIVGQTMQFHGAASLYSLSGASAVATLYSDASTSTSNPAVSLRTVAAGQAAAFSYDLAKSVMLTRQGNPDWAGDERDGSSPIRPNDLFYGAKIGDVKPDWIDLNKVAIPQADEQQRLLGNMITFMTQDRKPLPKLWYLPKGAKAAVVMVGDDHATSTGTADSFDALQTNSPSGCNVSQWECYRATSLVYPNSGYTDAQTASHQAAGFEVGVHVTTGCSDWTPASLTAAFTNDIAAFHQSYPSANTQVTTRTHCIAWSDWSTSASTEQTFGTRLDLNYYYWPNSWIQNRSGFMTGSGMPMRFGDTGGNMIDTYQQPSHLVNEAYSSESARMAAITSVLDRAVGQEGYYGAFGTHYDYSDNFDTQLRTAAAARNIPLVSGRQLLDWTDGRNSSWLKSTQWDASTGTLTIAANADAKTNGMLRGMLPLSYNGKLLNTLSRDGTGVSFTTETIKGIAYALFPVQSGTFSASYAADTTAPTIISTLPTQGATDVSVNASPSATLSEDIDSTTITTSTFELRDASNALVNATTNYNSATKTAALNPTASLSANSAYTATLKGGTNGVKDLAGNPLAADEVWSFTTGDPYGCPCSIFTTGTPDLPNANDPSAVELGVKFQSDIAGSITGIRFYKGPAGNTGTHTGSLWASDGSLLATATFSNETASGWQQVTFATPVAITANTTYIASYFAPTGFYAASPGMLANQITTTPLQALASGASGGNGVYKYGGGYPDQTFNSNNYWVDVVFTPTS